MRIGYFAQHTVESLMAGASPIDHMKRLAPDGATQVFRDFLGKWNFPGDRAFESIDGFSGGEKARLALAMIAFKQPNVLLLDEPTNHLDLDMREALAEALSDFDGAIVLVSHDRHLIGLVCDRFARVADGQVEDFDGDLDQYAAWLRTRPGSESAKAEKEAKAAKAVAPVAPPPPPKKPAQKINAHALAKAEAKVADLETQVAAVDAALADPAAYADPAKVADLGRRQAQLRAELERAESDLLALYDTA
jgi:ATP-binding cassette subfamily F protein 3